MWSLPSANRKCFHMCPGLPSPFPSPFLILGSPVVSALPNLASPWGLHYPNNIPARADSLLLCFFSKLCGSQKHGPPAAQLWKPLSNKSASLSASGPQGYSSSHPWFEFQLHKFPTSNFGHIVPLQVSVSLKSFPMEILQRLNRMLPGRKPHRKHELPWFQTVVIKLYVVLLTTFPLCKNSMLASWCHTYCMPRAVSLSLVLHHPFFSSGQACGSGTSLGGGVKWGDMYKAILQGRPGSCED